MKCDNCPSAWAERDIMTECGVEHGEYGCLIRGREYGGEGESCPLTEIEIRNRLRQLELYERGEIVRPQWIVNRFINDMDRQMDIGVECGLPGYPPHRMPKTTHYDEYGEEHHGVYKQIYGSTDAYYERCYAYKQGYEDAKAGKECNPHSYYGPKRKEKITKEDIFE